MNTVIRVICFTILLSVFPFRARAEDFTNAIHAYLKQYIDAQKINGCIVIGIVDENGSRVISYGKLDNGTDQQADGNTVFALHSATGTFNDILLQDMAERGQMKLDDPVAKYLPGSVKMPTYNGKQITLRHLAKETSGLPDYIDSHHPKRADNPLADFTVEEMDAFVSSCQLTCQPGTKHNHGGVDRGLLGQAMSLKAGTDYESLSVDRIFGPLRMDGTRFTLTPELKSRLASEHNSFGYAIPSWDWGALNPLAGLYSTTNDLLKFISAFGLKPCDLTPTMKAVAANLSYAPQIEGIIHTGGGGYGGGCYVGYDIKRRRGVSILTTSYDLRRQLGNFLLESEWQSDSRPKAAKIDSKIYDSYAGQYRRSPDFALGIFALRVHLSEAPKSFIFLAAFFCLAGLSVLLWRVGSSRKRWAIIGCLVVVCGLLAPLTVLASSRAFCARFQPGIGIRREGLRLIAQAAGLNLCPIEEWKFVKAWGYPSNPIDALFPPIPAELLPESETRFFERLSDAPITFSRDTQGKVTGLTLYYRGKTFSYEKIFDEPPKAPEPPIRPVAITLDTKLLDACVGRYEFPPDAMFPAGMKLTISRERDHLVAQGLGKRIFSAPVEMCPESETNFFPKIDFLQLSFVKNSKGEASAVIKHYPGYPDCEGKKVNNLSE